MSRDYKPAAFKEIPKANYSNPKWRTGTDLIVVHVSGGSAQSAYNTFSDANREASYHYIVDFDGDVWQFVREAAVSWHAGYWAWNQRSIGVSMAGSLEHNRDKSDGMYESLARLIAHLSIEHGVPIDRDHIKGHYQVPGCPTPGRGGVTCHGDPQGENGDFKWRRLLRLAREKRKEWMS